MVQASQIDATTPSDEKVVTESDFSSLVVEDIATESPPSEEEDADIVSINFVFPRKILWRV